MPTPAVSEIADWIFAGLLFGTLLAAAVSDIKYRLIPNWTVFIVLVLFVMRTVGETEASTVSSLEAALIVFLVSFALYALKLVGAGDSKLVTVVALFVGLERLAQFAFATAVAGGALAVVCLAANPVRALVMFQMRGKGDLERNVPYGVAIAVAGIFTFSQTLRP